MMHDYFNNLNIRYKMMCAFSLCAVLVGLFVFFFFPHQQRKQILNQVKKDSLTISKVTAFNLTSSIEYGDRAEAKEILTILRESESFLFALIKDADLRPFAAINEDGILQLDLLEHLNGPPCQIVGDVVITNIEVISRGKKVGMLNLGLSIKNIKAEIFKNSIVAIFLIVIMVAGIILTSVLVGDLITGPIQKVIEFSTAIAQGDFSSELEVTSHDEVGTLSRTCNEMSRKLSASIKEHERSEERLRESEKWLSTILKSIGDGIIVTDEAGKVIFLNKIAESLTGWRQQEAKGAPLENIFIIESKDTNERIETPFVKVMREGAISNLPEHTVLNTKEGERISIDDSGGPIIDDKGMIRGVVIVFRDVTEKEKAEQKVKETGEFLEKVIESSSDGIVICDVKGNITSVNSALETMNGFKREELINRHISILTIEDKEVRNIFLEKVAELFEKGCAIFEADLKSKGDNHNRVECNSSMITDIKGNHIAGMAIVRNISERRMMEQKLLHTEKLKSLGELAGGVAHNLNNILAAILGRTQLLRCAFDPPPGKKERRKTIPDLRKGLEIIEKAAHVGAATVRRIQVFARERNDTEGKTEVDLSMVIEDALEFTKTRWKNEAESKNKKVTVKKELSPALFISGVESELRELFTNLINNAIDSLSGDGEIRVRTSRDNNHVVIKVEDTGCGIPENVKNNIFDPFFTTKGFEASGLGLSASYGIINRYQGTINVESAEGEGTTFTITFPLSMRTGEGKVKEEKIIPITRKQKRARILIVEDEEDVRQLLFEVLNENGHEIETASDGIQGIAMFKESNYDMVFTDLGMPGMTGWQVAQEVKKKNRKTPVALITGWIVQLKQGELKNRGVDFVVSKPFKINQILQLVQTIQDKGNA